MTHRDLGFVAPRTVAEALDALADGESLAVGGGTSVALLLKHRMIEPARLVHLAGVAGLAGIARTGAGDVRIGATTTLRDVARSPLVRSLLPALAKAAAQVGNPRVRAVATMAGGLVHGDPRQDVPPVLLALAARVRLTGPAGPRTMAVREFGHGLMTTAAGDDELVTDVLVPVDPALRTVYLRFAPGSRSDYPTVSVAVALGTGADGALTRARIALGSVGGTALLADRAAALLEHQVLDDDLVAAAAASAAAAAGPQADQRGSADYKRAMVEVWTRRALLAASPARG